MSIRRNLFGEFEEIDRKFDEIFHRIFSEEPMWDMRGRTLKPLYEVKETKDSVFVIVDLPYVEKEGIELNVNEESVYLSADLCQPVRYSHWGTAQRNCEFRKMSATIRLPKEIIPDATAAKFKEGILTIELPKKLKKKHIPVE